MTRHPGTFIAGVFYILIGILSLLEVLDVWRFRAATFWPLFLIAIGAAVIAGAHRPEDRGLNRRWEDKPPSMR